MKVLIINICKERLHYFEFVKPIEDILNNEGVDYLVKNYNDIDKKSLEVFDRIIICGTSLKDNYFLKDIGKFNWLKDFGGSVFGICGGMQIIGLVFGGEIKEKLEIGFYNEEFEKEFLELIGKVEVYHLHENIVLFNEDFEKYNSSEVFQAVKHKEKEIYGVLFHPEVRNKDVILEFLKR